MAHGSATMGRWERAGHRFMSRLEASTYGDDPLIDWTSPMDKPKHGWLASRG